MNMNKLFAGLIAFVAGVALSAGSAFATNGYVSGDYSRVKLVPYYETGDSRATIIGIQNTSPQETTTMALNQDVADLTAYLGGAVPAAGSDMLTNLKSLLPADNQATGDAALVMTNLNAVAAVETALEAANMAAYTEHLFVMVNAYDSMGMMMGSATLCLAENQFGVVVLQGPMDMMGMDGMQMQVLSAMDEEIPAYGSVRVMAEDRKFTGCGATAPNTLMNVDTRDLATDAARTNMAESTIAAWTIIQDVGDGFFGTEVPTSTLTTAAAMDDATTADVNEAEQLTCNTGTDLNPATPTLGRTGFFHMPSCGLVPERHNNTRTADADTDMNGHDDPTAGTATPRATITARYDAGDESMVYVWLAEGMDTEDTLPRDRRMLEVTVTCEDGMMPAGPDTDGDNMPNPVTAAAPGMLTMIDPTMGDVGDLTDQCAGDRGVLNIRMPDGSYAGTAFSHITQMTGHYRMNFPGYSMASPTPCTAAANNCP